MDSKSLFLSKTFWGAVVMALGTFLPQVFTRFGYSPNADTEAVVVGRIIDLVGFGLTMYGRWVANSPVHVLPPKS